MENIAIFSQSALYFAAPFLAKALGCSLYAIDATVTDPYDLGAPVFVWTPGARINCDHIIIIGARALELYAHQLKSHKTAAVIFSDTNFYLRRESCIKICNENNVAVYAMPDKLQYTAGLDRPAVPVYQTITLPTEITPRAEHATPAIFHSPGAKTDSNAKGTKQIEGILKELAGKYDFTYNRISGACWRDCVAQKLQADIFIDQLIFGNDALGINHIGKSFAYSGGLGKSGLEAMLAGCCVVTGAPQPDVADCPPIFWESASTIKVIIEKLLMFPTVARLEGERQKAWAEKNCSPEFVAARVTRHINE